LVPVKGR